MKLKFGMLGAHHGHRGAHVKVASENPDRFELVGFYEPDPEFVEKNLSDWPRDFGGIEVKAFPTAEALLESDIEAIVVEGQGQPERRLCAAGPRGGEASTLGKAPRRTPGRIRGTPGFGARKGFGIEPGLSIPFPPRSARAGAPGRGGCPRGPLLFPRAHVKTLGVASEAGRRFSHVQRGRLFRDGRPLSGPDGGPARGACSGPGLIWEPSTGVVNMWTTRWWCTSTSAAWRPSTPLPCT